MLQQLENIRGTETVIISEHDFDNSFNVSLIASIFSILESEIESAVSEVRS